jgi:very-short-patch-repair endonuclease
MTRSPDLAVAALARRQHGVWSRQQALGAAMTRAMLRTRLASGRWVRLDTAVFCDIASRPTWERSVLAAILAEPWAVASHRTAAVIHELEGFRPGRPEITIRPGANARGRLALAHRGTDVLTTRINDIPVVTLPQVFVDLSQVVSESRLVGVLGDCAGKSNEILPAVRDRYCALAPRGGRDLRPLKAALMRFGAGDLPTETELERNLRVVLTSPEIPEIRWQAPFPGRDPGRRRVDGLIEAWSLIVEGDGRAWHSRVHDFERDRRRDAEAAAAGLQTLRFTWHQVSTEAAWVRATVIAAGAHRAAA